MLTPPRSFDEQGRIGWRWHVLLLLTACLIVLSRKPDVLFCPQFHAEDGRVFFAQAYNLGWIRTLTKPYAGYLHTFPRFVAAFSLLLPLRFAPLIMNLAGMLLQVLPVTLLLSARASDWGDLLVRAAYASAYLSLPNSWEINVNLACSQFHFALVALLILLCKPPRTAAGIVIDTIVIGMAGLTGPFSMVLFPIAFLLWWARRTRRSLFNAGILALCGCLQAFVLFTATGDSARLSVGPLGATPQRLIRILAEQVFAGALIGGNTLGFSHDHLLVSTISALGVGLLIYVLGQSNLELRLFILFSFLLLCTSLIKPLIAGDAPAWVLLLEDQGARYWFFPMLATVWSIIWCARYAPLGKLRAASYLALGVMLIGVVRDWSYPAYPDRNFAQYAKAFAQAPSGKVFTIPIIPDTWNVFLVKK